MSEVKHYDHAIAHGGSDDPESFMMPSEQGASYVEYEKYAELKAQREIQKQRAEAAEAKLAELEKQEPVHTKLKYSSVLPKFIGDTDEVESYHCMIHGNTPDRKTMEEAYADAKQMCGDLFTRPAPAINLAELVPHEGFLEGTSDESILTWQRGWNACRAAIIRKIEGAE